MSATRISPHDAMEKTKEGALLVCAYDDEEKCNTIKLEGAISLGALQARQPSKQQELIFYCA